MPKVVDRLLRIGRGFGPILGALLDVEIVAGCAGLVRLIIGQRTIQAQANREGRHVLMLRGIVDGRVRPRWRHIVGADIGTAAGARPQVSVIVVVGDIGQRVCDLEAIQRWPRYSCYAIGVADSRVTVIPIAIRGEYREVSLARILHRVCIGVAGALVHFPDRIQRGAQGCAAERID